MSILKRKSKVTFCENHWLRSQAAVLHEYTKYSELNLFKKTPRITEYMSSSQYILETARNRKEYLKENSISLLPPESKNVNFTELFLKRRSSHDYSGQAVKFQEMSNLLGWSAGVTQRKRLDKKGLEDEIFTSRSYPSGGGLYPCETYVIALNVERLSKGVYHYNNLDHSLDPIDQDLKLTELNRIFMADDYLTKIGFVIIVTSMFERQMTKYGDRAYRLSLIESGHLMQNILLSATAQNLASLSWGGFHDNEVALLLQTDVLNEPPVHMAFVGKGS